MVLWLVLQREGMPRHRPAEPVPSPTCPPNILLLHLFIKHITDKPLEPKENVPGLVREPVHRIKGDQLRKLLSIDFCPLCMLT